MYYSLSLIHRITIYEKEILIIKKGVAQNLQLFISYLSNFFRVKPCDHKVTFIFSSNHIFSSRLPILEVNFTFFFVNAFAFFACAHTEHLRYLTAEFFLAITKYIQSTKLIQDPGVPSIRNDYNNSRSVYHKLIMTFQNVFLWL